MVFFVGWDDTGGRFSREVRRRGEGTVLSEAEGGSFPGGRGEPSPWLRTVPGLPGFLSEGGIISMNANNSCQYRKTMMWRLCPYWGQLNPQPNPYISQQSQYMLQQTNNIRQQFSYMRLLHASPNLQTVDVYANGSPIALGLANKGFTEYLQMVPGRYNVQIFAAGTTAPALLDTIIELPGQSINTAVIIGLSPNITMKTFFETVIQIPPGQLYLRFANLVPNSPDMDLVLSDGTRLFEDVTFGMATNYRPITAGTYEFNLLRSDTGARLLYVPNISLGERRFYTIYAVGQIGGTLPLQVLIPLDGNSYLQV